MTFEQWWARQVGECDGLLPPDLECEVKKIAELAWNAGQEHADLRVT